LVEIVAVCRVTGEAERDVSVYALQTVHVSVWTQLNLEFHFKETCLQFLRYLKIILYHAFIGKLYTMSKD